MNTCSLSVSESIPRKESGPDTSISNTVLYCKPYRHHPISIRKTNVDFYQSSCVMRNLPLLNGCLARIPVVVAQVVELPPWDLEVVSSNPGRALPKWYQWPSCVMFNIIRLFSHKNRITNVTQLTKMSDQL